MGLRLETNGFALTAQPCLGSFKGQLVAFGWHWHWEIIRGVNLAPNRWKRDKNREVGRQQDACIAHLKLLSLPPIYRFLLSHRNTHNTALTRFLVCPTTRELCCVMDLFFMYRVCMSLACRWPGLVSSRAASVSVLLRANVASRLVSRTEAHLTVTTSRYRPRFCAANNIES